MTTQSLTDELFTLGEDRERIRVQKRRIQGLSLPVVPSGSWLAQVGGGIAAGVGVYLQWGLAITLFIGGIAAVVLGMLKEADKI